MPTKARVAKGQAIKQAKAEFDKVFAKCIKTAGLDPFQDLHKLTSQKNLVIYDKDDGVPESHPRTGKGGNDMRRDDRRDEALRLRNKYIVIWHQRGAAKRIAIDENLSVRTIQKYIKNFPIE